MSTSCGQDKPHSISKNVIFSCLIGIYFSPFFIEHPVVVLVFTKMEMKDVPKKGNFLKTK